MVRREKVRGLDKSAYVRLLENYRDRCKPEIASIQSQLDKRLVIVKCLVEGKLVRAVVVHGNRLDQTRVYVLTPGDKRLHSSSLKWLVYLEGGPRGIYWPAGITMGRTSLMGGVAHAIKSSKAFRGR